MWALGQKAEKYGRLPSSFFADMVDELTIYQFDNAILWFCSTIEAAALEREPVGDPKKTHETRPKYEFDDLLDDDFRMPRPPSKLQKRVQGAAKLLDLAYDPSVTNVKIWREKKPGE